MVMTVEEKKASRKATMAKYNAKESVKVSKAKWLLDNKESHKMAKLKYRLNPENKERERVGKKKYNAENKEKIATYMTKYAAENRAKIAVNDANRRARKFGATIYMTKEDKAKIAELYEIEGTLQSYLVMVGK